MIRICVSPTGETRTEETRTEAGTISSVGAKVTLMAAITVVEATLLAASR